MKRFLLFLLVAGMFFAAGAAKSYAGDQDFVLVNNTGVEINNLYVSPANSDEWGDDILGDNAVGDGDNVTVKFPHEADECEWDFMVKDEEGTGIQWTDIDLCKYGKITLHIDEGKAIATFE
jgi:hypothetical protein